MDIIRTTANLIGYNLESVESSVPYIEPYVFTKGLYKGKNVKELVAMGVPGLRALILMMNSSPENEYKCANSILYELMLEAQNILDKCDDDTYGEYLGVLYELLGTLPNGVQRCGLFINIDCKEGEEPVCLFDVVMYGEPFEQKDYLESIVHDLTLVPVFYHVSETDIMLDENPTNGTCGVIPGMKVAIVLKANQGTDKLDAGIVDEVLTKSPTHPRGIKVRLKDGKIGRVQKVFC